MYERKGRLYKKSLNSEVFKERWFVLERDHLFYFKSEKNSKMLFIFRRQKFQPYHIIGGSHQATRLRSALQTNTDALVALILEQTTAFHPGNRKRDSQVRAGCKVAVWFARVGQSNLLAHRNSFLQSKPSSKPKTDLDERKGACAERSKLNREDSRQVEKRSDAFQ